MDTNPGYGLILIAMALAAQIFCKHCGIDGNIDATIQGILAMGGMLLGAKSVFNARHQNEKEQE